jgi:glycosyltransferase involved in cell wall biosynthesis
MLRTGIDGELVPRGDAEAMGQAMRRVLDNGTLARQMGQSAAERVRAVYQLDRTIQRYSELYSQLAAERGAARA